MTPAKIIEYAHQVPGLGCKGNLHGERCGQIQDALQSATDAEINIAVEKCRRFCGDAQQGAQQAQAQRNRDQFIAMSSAAKAAYVIGQQIALPPGGCEECLNTREVPSTLVPGTLTKCQACAQSAEGAVA